MSGVTGHHITPQSVRVVLQLASHQKVCEQSNLLIRIVMVLCASVCSVCVSLTFFFLEAGALFMLVR